MITQEQQIQGVELIKTLAQKAWESSAFKDQLVNNPVSAIESVTGQKINTGAKFVVEDQTNESIIYLNIPRKLDIDELELTDEQLEMVSGGSTPFCAYAIGFCAGVAFTAACAGVAAVFKEN